MFVLRGLVVAFGVSILVYAVLSAVVALGWRLLGKRTALRGAQLLYALRLSPFASTAIFVTFFVVPSYLYFEPRIAEEDIGFAAAALAIAAAVFVLAGLLDAVRAWRNTARFVRGCLHHSHALPVAAAVPVFEVSDPRPAVMIAGVFRPRVLVSSGALDLLDDKELEAALRHEAAHAGMRDNLRKLSLRLCRFPMMSALEADWMAAAEIAADEHAARDESAALDLASAVVKMARVERSIVAPELSMTLAPGAGSAVEERVQNLISGKRIVRLRLSSLHWTALALAACALLTNYPWALAQVHEFTELLLR